MSGDDGPSCVPPLGWASTSLSDWPLDALVDRRELGVDGVQQALRVVVERAGDEVDASIRAAVVGLDRPTPGEGIPTSAPTLWRSERQVDTEASRSLPRPLRSPGLNVPIRGPLVPG